MTSGTIDSEIKKKIKRKIYLPASESRQTARQDVCIDLPSPLLSLAFLSRPYVRMVCCIDSTLFCGSSPFNYEIQPDISGKIQRGVE